MNKFIAVVSCFSFLLTSVFAQPVSASLQALREPDVFSNPKLEAGSSFIPASIGKITSGEFFPTGLERRNGVVVLIQDLHCHAEVQRNIAKIIETLDKRFSIPTVFAEGAAGTVDTSWFDSFPNPGIRRKIVESLLNKGKLTGAEYYSILSNKPTLITGIEQKDIHTQNLIRLNTLLQHKADIRTIIDEVRKEADTLESRFYNSKHKKFGNFIRRYHDGTIKPGKFCKIINKYIIKTEININDYLQVENWAKLLKLKKSLRRQNIAKEFQSVNPIKLLREEKKLIREINYRLSQSNSEREIMFLTDFVDVLDSYVSAKISADDYEYFTQNLPKFKFLWAKYSDSSSIKELDQYWTLLKDYYQTNIERNDCFIRNIVGETGLKIRGGLTAQGSGNSLPLLSLDPVSPLSIISGQPVYVVVSGGFHTAGLTKLLEQRKISYLVITPNITQSTKTSESVYNELIAVQSKLLVQSPFVGVQFQTVSQLCFSVFLMSSMKKYVKYGKASPSSIIQPSYMLPSASVEQLTNQLNTRTIKNFLPFSFVFTIN